MLEADGITDLVKEFPGALLRVLSHCACLLIKVMLSYAWWCCPVATATGGNPKMKVAQPEAPECHRAGTLNILQESAFGKRARRKIFRHFASRRKKFRIIQVNAPIVVERLAAKRQVFFVALSSEVLGQEKVCNRTQVWRQGFALRGGFASRWGAR
jgi:hypothetical protein